LELRIYGIHASYRFPRWARIKTINIYIFDTTDAEERDISEINIIAQGDSL